MSDDEDQEEPKVYGVRHGECIANADPLGIGRVKVRITGVCEESAWALPLDFGGRKCDVPYTRSDYARFNPPQDRDGDECAVWFSAGDVNFPFYLRAHGGIPEGVPEVPEPVKTLAKEDAAWLKVWEWAIFRVELDERPATKGLRITDKSTNEVLLEYDGVSQSLRLKSIAGLTLAADGAVIVEGLTITLKPRDVAREVEARPETI